MSDIASFGERVLTVTRVLVHYGLIRGFGHVSARLPEGDKFVISGHIHGSEKTMDSLTLEDMIVIDLDGKKVSGKLDMPEERYIHSCIYKARDDIGGAIHFHPVYSTVLSIAGKHVLPVFLSSLLFAPKVPIFDDPNLVHDDKRGQAMAKAMGDSLAVVIRGHGSASAGSTPEEAGAVAILLEETARMQLLAAQAGEPRAISLSEMDSEFVKKIPHRHGLQSMWNYCVSHTLKATAQKS
jgi:L-fuculose-phosphate aldolase